MALKSLEATFIYRYYNKDGVLTKNIGALMTKGMIVGEKQIEDSIMVIMKNFKFPLKYKVIEAFRNGDIQLRYAIGSKLPTCLPFFLCKGTDGRIMSVVSVDIYGRLDEDTNDIKIDPKKLYCMMEAAYLAKVCYVNSKQVVSRPVILSGGSQIYSSMFTNVLKKKYSLNVDKTKMHKVLFLSSKFYFINILGLADNDIVFNYAIKNCPNGNIYSLKEVNEQLQLDDYASIETFIKALARPELGLKMNDLTIRGYLDSFINMYEASNLFSLESFPYMLYNILSVTNGAYINNQYIMEDIVDRYGAKIYTDLTQLDK